VQDDDEECHGQPGRVDPVEAHVVVRRFRGIDGRLPILLDCSRAILASNAKLSSPSMAHRTELPI
jgi:hypothetical protein